VRHPPRERSDKRSPARANANAVTVLFFRHSRVVRSMWPCVMRARVLRGCINVVTRRTRAPLVLLLVVGGLEPPLGALRLQKLNRGVGLHSRPGAVGLVTRTIPPVSN
jgi:hypothetical protein